MRTTVTLDADVEALLHRRMAERGVSFKRALNDAVRDSAAATEGDRFRTPTYSMGAPLIDLDRALSLAGELEDLELERRMKLSR